MRKFSVRLLSSFIHRKYVFRHIALKFAHIYINSCVIKMLLFFNLYVWLLAGPVWYGGRLVGIRVHVLTLLRGIHVLVHWQLMVVVDVVCGGGRLQLLWWW